MKIIAVRNAQIHPQFQPTVHLGFDPATSDLSVSLYLPALATDEAACGDTGLSLIESVVVNVGDLRKRYDWCDHQTYFVAVHAGAFLPVFALYPETLPNRETAVDYAQRLKRNLLVGINVPFAAASDDELFITVNLNAQATDARLWRWHANPRLALRQGPLQRDSPCARSRSLGRGLQRGRLERKAQHRDREDHLSAAR